MIVVTPTKVTIKSDKYQAIVCLAFLLQNANIICKGTDESKGEVTIHSNLKFKIKEPIAIDGLKPALQTFISLTKDISPTLDYMDKISIIIDLYFNQDRKQERAMLERHLNDFTKD